MPSRQSWGADITILNWVCPSTSATLSVMCPMKTVGVPTVVSRSISMCVMFVPFVVVDTPMRGATEPQSWTLCANLWALSSAPRTWVHSPVWKIAGLPQIVQVKFMVVTFWSERDAIGSVPSRLGMPFPSSMRGTAYRRRGAQRPSK